MMTSNLDSDRERRAMVLRLADLDRQAKAIDEEREDLKSRLATMPEGTYTADDDQGQQWRLDVRRTYRLDQRKVEERYRPAEHPDFYRLALNTKVIRAAVPADDLHECETPTKPYATVSRVKDGR